jgi:uncharacterized protein (DUF2252 family)
MDIVPATRSYGQWLSKQFDVVAHQLVEKHARMAASPMEFLRGTFYRWVQTFPEICPNFQSAHRVLAVGDLHIASFGTWHDQFGRLVWGIDDFDEASYLPYASDLIRLAVSAVIDSWEGELKIHVKQACNAVLDGYRSSLERGGRTFVLEERHSWLRKVALKRLDKPHVFWKKLNALPSIRTPVPQAARRALRRILPAHQAPDRIARRVSGLGSLGHPRLVGILLWEGSHLALEAKPLAPSAAVWANPEIGDALYYDRIMTKSVRCLDPFVRVVGRWLVRQLSPDSSPIEIESMANFKDQDRLLHAMAFETANIHLGTPSAAKRVIADLASRSVKSWRAAIMDMAKKTVADWQEWKRTEKKRTHRR